jgi:hypothetical protein
MQIRPVNLFLTQTVVVFLEDFFPPIISELRVCHPYPISLTVNTNIWLLKSSHLGSLNYMFQSIDIWGPAGSEVVVITIFALC